MPAFGLTPAQVNAAASAQWRQTIRQALTDTRCATPAFLVEDMGATTAPQTVKVQIAIQERVRPPQGAAQWWDVPPIVNVPIIVPRGGGFSITLPLKKGDNGLLIFCDTCFDLWWANGQTNAPPAQNVTAPSGSQIQNEVRRHYVHDCGFLPGMWSHKDLLTDYSTSSLQIRSDDGTTVIDVSETGVLITGPTVALSNGAGVSASTASGSFGIQAAAIALSNGGTTLPLMTHAWQVWFTTYVLPHIVTGVIPTQPDATTVLQGQ
jgi:hypothetical protein